MALLSKSISLLDKKGESMPLSVDEVLSRRGLFEEPWKKLKMKENLLFQKSRVQWIREGYANTGFFHACVNGRRRKNQINALMVDSQWIKSVDGIKDVVKNHFTKVCNEDWWSKQKFQNLHFKSLSSQDNLFLCFPLTLKEVKKAVWCCEENKSPGPDGFNFKFIRTFWGFIQNKVCAMVSEFHANSSLPVGFISTFVALIPKKANPQAINDF